MLTSKRKSLLALALTLSVASFARASCPIGDLNGDCQISLQDLLVFAEQWLVPPESPADLNRDDRINMADFALLARTWNEGGIPLVINEVLASNSSVIADPQGEYDDWIEIHNHGEGPVDLGGMYLTDDPQQPTNWRFPADQPAITTIAPGGYVVVWADGDVGDVGLHAGFGLSASGDEVLLFDTDGETLIDSISFPQQQADISFGRVPNGGKTLRFMVFPSPGGPNIAVYQGFVADVQFSHERGFYDGPFDLSMTCSTPDAPICYTTDGSPPIANDMPTGSSRVYTGPIPIHKTICVRAAAIKVGWKSSGIDTHTYILNAGGALKALPVVSLVGDANKTFFEPDGIMAIVGGYYDGEVWRSDGPGSYNNVVQRGIAYERPVSFEILDPQTGSAFQVDCGIRVHGSDYTRPRYTRGDEWLSCFNGWPSMNTNKFSFNLYFRSSYGPNRLDHALFPFIDVDRFRSIVLRGGHNDACAPFVKDEWARRLFREMGHVQVTGTFANLYLNGAYKAYYNPSSRLDQEFLQEWYGTDNEFDVINQSGLRDGSWTAWNNLLNYAESHDLANTTDYEYVAGKLDIAAFIDFLILEIYIANFDWPGNNWEVHRERSDTGIFRCSVWDAEGLAETWAVGDNFEMTAFEDYPTWANPRGLNRMTDPISRLYRALRASPYFRQRFADHVHKHFYNGGILTEQRLLARWWEVFAEVSAVLPETERYPVRFVPDQFIPNRERHVLAAFEENGLFNRSFSAPRFNINGIYQHGGYVSAGDILTMTNPNSTGTVYYTLDGTDPGIPGMPPHQVVDTVLVAESAPKRALVPTSEVEAAWKGGGAFDDSGWMSVTGSPGGVGYERGSGYEQYISLDVEPQMYNRTGGCYIRIPFDVTGDPSEFELMILRVRYDDGFVAYINGVEVERAMLSGTPRWNSYASGGHEAGGLQPFDISNRTHLLRQGRNILAIHGLNVSRTSSDFIISTELAAGYLAGGTEPGVSDSGIEYTGPITLTGSTYVKARVMSDDALSALNEAVFAVGPVAQSLRISEVMYHPLDTGGPDDPNTEYIELVNTGSEVINLSLARFTNGVDFTFGDTDLAPGAYTLIVKDTAAFEAKYSPGKPVAGQYTGSLANNGERIELQDAAGQVIHNFRYRDSWYDITDGLGFSLTVNDPAVLREPNALSDKALWRPSAHIHGSPGEDDSGQVPAIGDVVINEILSHSHAGRPDWIELHNTTDQAVNIGGWFLSDDADDLQKYEIAEGTTIPPNGYVVFYEDTHFGNVADPGTHQVFALSENGETLHLHSGADGQLTGYSEREKFGASETGVAFGRYRKSTGTYNFVAMAQPTPGAVNSYPKVGPLVITEIMYHPNTVPDAEYVELLNVSDTSVVLYDFVERESWRFTDDPDDPGIELIFPSADPVIVAAGETILLAKNLTLFEARFTLPQGVRVFEWGAGRLANGSEKIQLSKPGEADLQGGRYWIRVDRVVYSDGSHHDDFASGVDPWPTEPDGQGQSLVRINPMSYGNDPANWRPAAPSPGEANP
ncbi:MAG: lamin tail domain-containing protein [Phycisphaerales bacterium]|nr:MAG: lamin tail domain-containing protein [Phycisphaerales bacterium]